MRAAVRAMIPAVAVIALTACSSSKGTRAAGVSTSPAVSALSELAGQISPLSMNRACTVAVASTDCVTATQAKIALTDTAQSELKAVAKSGISDQALQVSDRILLSGQKWTRLECPMKPIAAACAAPAMAVESDFSVLSAFLLQVSDR